MHDSTIDLNIFFDSVSQSLTYAAVIHNHELIIATLLKEKEEDKKLIFWVEMSHWDIISWQDIRWQCNVCNN